MQLLQWLFKGENDQERKRNFSSSAKRRVISHDSNAKGKHIILRNKHRRGQRRRRRRRRRGGGVEASKLGCKNVKISGFVCTKDIAKAGLYSTLEVRSSDGRQQFIYSVKMKREEMDRGIGFNNKKADSAAAHIGNKVPPRTEASILSITSADRNYDQFENKDQIKGHKRNKPISIMKGLFRRAAAAKSEIGGKLNGRKVLPFQRRGTLKTVADEDRVTSESPKISASSSLYLARKEQIQTAPSSTSSSTEAQTQQIACREGHWITTDSEFVVLEL